MSEIKFSRVFSMPNSETFSMKPVEQWVKYYLSKSIASVDPFARNKRWATHTNDLDPNTSAEYNEDAEDFCKRLKTMNVECDFALFDPPYSPRQISECYKNIGLKVGIEETQNGRFYKRVRDALDKIVLPGGIVLSFGWNSAGMGKTRGYIPLEILLVQHGGAHNDTICLAERKA